MFGCLLGLSFGVAKAQKAAVKTNGLYWLTTTINGGVEVALADRWTLEAVGAWNPWTFNGKKLRLWLAQPEVRYWFCEKFEGHFVGAHVHGAQYYLVNDRRRFDGYLVGGGISYGYDWILSPHWNLELTAGAGYARLWYEESERLPCVKCTRTRYRNYFGPTRLGVNFVYLF